MFYVNVNLLKSQNNKYDKIIESTPLFIEEGCYTNQLMQNIDSTFLEISDISLLNDIVIYKDTISFKTLDINNNSLLNIIQYLSADIKRTNIYEILKTPVVEIVCTQRLDYYIPTMKVSYTSYSENQKQGYSFVLDNVLFIFIVDSITYSEMYEDYFTINKNSAKQFLYYIKSNSYNYLLPFDNEIHPLEPDFEIFIFNDNNIRLTINSASREKNKSRFIYNR